MTAYIRGATGVWEVVIGLEVHAQVTSKSKLFSGASTDFGAEPNTQVSFVDAGFPGMLPVINTVCVRQAIKTGLGLHAQINNESVFDRKNYFYADLPTGYQISQFKKPIVGEGYLDIDIEDDKTKRIRIERIHLEQDAGKSIHDMDPHKSFIDFNRAGIALMEIVSMPDMRSSEEAKDFMRKLRSLVKYLGTCDGNMEQGSMRADANVSLHRPGTPYGTRAEIKNLNSVRFLGQAIEYEIKRQMEILEDGGEIKQETRLFDSTKCETRSMRSKEDAHDYRYFPDPDLPPLIVTKAEIDEIRGELPELPDIKQARFVEQYGLRIKEAAVLVSEKEYAAYYEKALEASEAFQDKAKASACAQLTANWILGELFAAINKDGIALDNSKVTPELLAGLVDLIENGTISGKIAKEVFADIWETGKPAKSIVQEKGLLQLSDDKAITDVVLKVINDNTDMVAQYRSGGKDKLFAFFVGQVMKATQGKANPSIVNKILKEKLG